MRSQFGTVLLAITGMGSAATSGPTDPDRRADLTLQPQLRALDAERWVTDGLHLSRTTSSASCPGGGRATLQLGQDTAGRVRRATLRSTRPAAAGVQLQADYGRGDGLYSVRLSGPYAPGMLRENGYLAAGVPFHTQAFGSFTPLSRPLLATLKAPATLTARGAGCALGRAKPPTAP